jgi:uncharacterized protein (TIGR03382 family)
MISKRFAALGLVLASLPACAAPIGSEEHVGEATDALTDVCPGASAPGIDIASFQHPGGAGINWGQVATAEKFVIVKATESSDYTNSYYAGDVAGARGAGLLVGSYHFLSPSSRTGVSGAAQAQYFLAHTSIKSGDLPPMLDVETSSLYGSVLPSVADVTGWLTTVESATGVKPLVYIGYYVIGDLGTPGALAGYPIDIPDYSACPNFPDSYPRQNLVMWQKTSTASIPGISGHVDADEFYGDINALLNFAHADQAATGFLDHAGCDGIRGWGWDPDNKTASTNVDVYFNGPAGAAGATGIRNPANISRPDLCTALGSCNHAFVERTPRSLFDGQKHDVHAYAIDLNGSENGELNQSPGSITCAPIEIPKNTVKRWITSPDVLNAWKFNVFTDVADLPQAKVDAEPDGAKISAGPSCVQADDGTAEVWVIDGGTRRHVINPDSLDAWRFTVTKTPASMVYANPKGLDWPATPDLLKGTAANVYMIDTAPPKANGTGGGSDSGGGDSTGAGSHHQPSGASTGVGGAGGSGDQDGEGVDKSSGCSTSGGDRSGGGWLAFFALTLLGAASRRRSHSV